MNASEEIIQGALSRHIQDNALVTKVMNEIAREVEANKPEKQPRQKKQNFLLVSDKFGILNDVNLVGWTGKIPEEDAIQTVQERIMKAAYDFNASKKGQKFPVTSIGEAIEAVPAKFFKEYGITGLTKEPMLVLTTDNVLPKE